MFTEKRYWYRDAYDSMKILIFPNMYVIDPIIHDHDEGCLISNQNIVQKLWSLIASMKKWQIDWHWQKVIRCCKSTDRRTLTCWIWQKCKSWSCKIFHTVWWLDLSCRPILRQDVPGFSSITYIKYFPRMQEF